MLSWFKRRQVSTNNAKEIIDGAMLALNRLGELVEKHPDGYMDERWLPLPKSDMKTALKILWVASRHDIEARNNIEMGWSLLSFFQPNVGDTPITPTISPGSSPEDVVTRLGPYLLISKLWETETQANKIEFAEFVRSQQ